MKPSPSVAPMQLLVRLQIYKINHAGRNSSKKKLTQIISDVQLTAIAWHLSNQLILHSWTWISFSPLFLLCRRRSKVWSIQWPVWKWAWDPTEQHHTRPQGPLPVFLLHLPKAFSLQEQAPQILGTVCRAHGPWSGVVKGQNWRLLYQLPSLKSYHPLILVSALEIHALAQPISQFVFCFSLSYPAHSRHRAAFLLPSERFEIGRRNL